MSTKGKIGMLQKVRTFEEKDIAKVADMLADVPDGWSRKALEDSLTNQNIKSFVLQQEDDIAAFAAYLVADDAELVFVVTDKNNQRKGCGRALLTQTLNFLKLPCVLEVRESNIPAINLYESVGFELIGKRKNFYTCPTEIAFIYKKEV